jgi:hypothetical protein
MELLATVNRHTGWTGEFQHWQQRHHHGRPEDRVVYAGVIGIGCASGIRKMARISHPISESELENVQITETVSRFPRLSGWVIMGRRNTHSKPSVTR